MPRRRFPLTDAEARRFTDEDARQMWADAFGPKSKRTRTKPGRRARALAVFDYFAEHYPEETLREIQKFIRRVHRTLVAGGHKDHDELEDWYRKEAPHWRAKGLDVPPLPGDFE